MSRRLGYLPSAPSHIADDAGDGRGGRVTTRCGAGRAPAPSLLSDEAACDNGGGVAMRDAVR